MAKPGQEQRLGIQHKVCTVERRRVTGLAAALQPELTFKHVEVNVFCQCAFLRTAEDIPDGGLPALQGTAWSLFLDEFHDHIYLLFLWCDFDKINELTMGAGLKRSVGNIRALNNHMILKINFLTHEFCLSMCNLNIQGMFDKLLVVQTPYTNTDEDLGDNSNSKKGVRRVFLTLNLIASASGSVLFIILIKNSFVMTMLKINVVLSF